MTRTALRVALASVIALIATIGPSAAQKDSNGSGETAADIVAAQIRSQGYACDEPSNAKRDEGASKPDEVVWTLTCKNATYRVRLIADMAAQVEQVD